MVYKHAVVAAFCIYAQRGEEAEVGGRAINSHGNYIVDNGKSWKNHWNCVFEFLWEPCYCQCTFFLLIKITRKNP